MKTISILLISSGLAVGAVTTSHAATSPDAPHALLPSAPRTVVVRETETPPLIRAGLLQSTLILLPPEEKVATVFGGDTVSWVFDGGHVASRFISIKPKVANTTTDVHIVSDHGNEYTLQLKEVSSDGDPHFDSKVFVTPGDQAGKDKLAAMPVFVPAAELDKAKREAQEAEARIANEHKAEAAKAEQYRSQYPGQLHFDYTWDQKKGTELGLQQVWRDDKFTVAIDFARGGAAANGTPTLAANANAPQTASATENTALPASAVAGSSTPPDESNGGESAGPQAQQRPPGLKNVAAQQSQKKDPMAAYDFDGFQGRLYRIFEGTVFEGVVTNHVDGGIAGPIIVMLTTDYYSHDHQQLLLPQGTRLIGNVQSVGNQQQRKLLVVFNRAVCPDGFSLDLNKYIGLDPIGTTGLATNVNNHILSSFAAAAAIGGLGGLAQIGNNGSVLTADTQIRNGISEQSAMEAEQILNHFLNRLPVITVKEGSRARVYINQDILIPSYAEHRVDSSL